MLKRMRRFAYIAAVLLLVAPLGARAATPLSQAHQSFRTAVLATTAINTACDASIHNVVTPACASFVMPMAGWTEATFIILYTKGAASAVQMQMDGAVDVDGSGTVNSADLPFAVLQTGIASATKFVMSSNPLEWDTSGMAGAATAAWLVTFTGINADWARWRLTSTGGNSSDTAKVLLVRVGK